MSFARLREIPLWSLVVKKNHDYKPPVNSCYGNMKDNTVTDIYFIFIKFLIKH